MINIYKATALILLNLISIFVRGQLTLSTNQLNFGNVFENSPDSLPLILTNNSGRDVTVTGIRFYNTYGSPAFSVSTSWFTINNGSNTTVYIKFSPKHNIFHNSEMIIENDGLRGNYSVDLLGQGKYSNHYYDLTENLAEENLKSVINVIVGNGYVSLGYNIARDSMFMMIDNKKINGQGASQNTIECIYTGRQAVGYASRSDCQTGYSFNTEHTLPQSLFLSAEPMKSDLHHLFPTDDVANNERGDNPFGVITNPSWSVGGSKSDGITFEPRDQQKGQSARALFYFTLRYQNYNNFLNSQETILRTWHKNFPPTQIDRKRNDDIFSIQHNRNPFVDYAVLIDRITSISTLSIAPFVSTIDLSEDTINYGTIQTGIPVIYYYSIVNNGNTNISFSNFSLTHPAELSFATSGSDTTIAAGESLTLQIRCLTTVTDSIRAFLSFNSNAPGQTSVTVPVFVNDVIFTNVNEINPDVFISPNPAHDQLTISIAGSSMEYDWTIFDMTGRDAMHGVCTKRNGVSTIDINGLKPGVYLFHLSGNDGARNKKIIIQ